MILSGTISCLVKRKSSRFEHTDEETETPESAWDDGKRKPPLADRLTDPLTLLLGTFLPAFLH